jgi:hypothetical protein
MNQMVRLDRDWGFFMGGEIGRTTTTTCLPFLIINFLTAGELCSICDIAFSSELDTTTMTCSLMDGLLVRSISSVTNDEVYPWTGRYAPSCFDNVCGIYRFFPFTA